MPYKLLTVKPTPLPRTETGPETDLVLVFEPTLSGYLKVLAQPKQPGPQWRYRYWERIGTDLINPQTAPSEHPSIVPLDRPEIKRAVKQLKWLLNLRDPLTGLSLVGQRLLHYRALGLGGSALHGAVWGETGLPVEEIKACDELLGESEPCLPRVLLEGSLPFAPRTLIQSILVSLETGAEPLLTSEPSLPGRWGLAAISRPLIRDGVVVAPPAGVAWSIFLRAHREDLDEAGQVREEDTCGAVRDVWGVARWDPEFAGGVRFETPEEYLRWWVPVWLEAHYGPELQRAAEREEFDKAKREMLFAIRMDARDALGNRQFFDEGREAKRVRIELQYGGHFGLLATTIEEIGEEPVVSDVPLLARDIWIKELKEKKLQTHPLTLPELFKGSRHDGSCGRS